MGYVESTTRKAGLTLTIEVDEYPECPRESFDHIGRMVCGHRNYKLGDTAKTLGWTFRSGDFDGWEAVEKALYEEHDAVLVLPLALYDHSGITMSIGTGGGWDSGQVGFIYVTKEALRENWPSMYCDEARIVAARKCLEAEVEEYDAYLRGNVYSYIITRDEDGESIDSCGGYYGLDDVKDVANGELDGWVRHFAKQAAKTDAANAIGAHI